MPISFFAVLRCLGAERVVEKNEVHLRPVRRVANRSANEVSFYLHVFFFLFSVFAVVEHRHRRSEFRGACARLGTPRRAGFGAQCGDRQHPSCCEIK